MKNIKLITLKMKNLILSFCFLISINFVLNAQNECKTLSPPPPSWIFNKTLKFTQATIINYRLNIFVHIIRSSNGVGLGTSILPTITSSLNSFYQNSGVQFNLMGSDFIDNDYYYLSLDDTKINQLFGINSHCNAIDIYVTGESTQWGYAGVAQGIPAKAYLIHGSYYTTTSLPHEMGHCLGLYHTHHGTVNEGGGDINQCPELVNGTNSTTCGDYISDTPADPNAWSSNSCVYIGTGHDANNQLYSPSTSNIMSYAYKPCRTTLTANQIDRIQNYMINSQILQNTVVSTLSGAPVLCTSDSYSINVIPSGCTISWNQSANITQVSAGDPNPCVFQKYSNGNGYINAVVSGCANYTLSIPVHTGPYSSSDYPISGPSSASCNSYVYYTIPVLNDVTNINWTWPSAWTYISGQNSPYLTLRTNNSGGAVMVGVSNKCGQSGSYAYKYTSVRCGYSLIVSPNPASEIVNISIIEPQSITPDSLLSYNMVSSTKNSLPNQNITYNVDIMDNMGILYFNTKVHSKLFTIPIQGLRNGNYLIIVSDGVNKFSTQLVVMH
jgi:hypothetical protein